MLKTKNQKFISCIVLVFFMLLSCPLNTFSADTSLLSEEQPVLVLESIESLDTNLDVEGIQLTKEILKPTKDKLLLSGTVTPVKNVILTVNGKKVTTIKSTGEFEYYLSLKAGEVTPIIVKAVFGSQETINSDYWVILGDGKAPVVKLTSPLYNIASSEEYLESTLSNYMIAGTVSKDSIVSLHVKYEDNEEKTLESIEVTKSSENKLTFKFPLSNYLVDINNGNNELWVEAIDKFGTNSVRNTNSDTRHVLCDNNYAIVLDSLADLDAKPDYEGIQITKDELLATKGKLKISGTVTPITKVKVIVNGKQVKTVDTDGKFAYDLSLKPSEETPIIVEAVSGDHHFVNSENTVILDDGKVPVVVLKTPKTTINSNEENLESLLAKCIFKGTVTKDSMVSLRITNNDGTDKLLNSQYITKNSNKLTYKFLDSQKFYYRNRP
ncbi:MAG: hypothetical protein WA125_14690 [Desulfosporosinus sp.]